MDFSGQLIELGLLFLATPLASLMALAFAWRAIAADHSGYGLRYAMFAIALLSIACWHTANALQASLLIINVNVIFRTELFFTFLTGPALYFYFRTYFESDFKWEFKKHGWLFLPTLLTLPVYFIPPMLSYEARQVQAILSGQLKDPFDYAIALGAFQNLLFLVYGGYLYLYPARERLHPGHALAFGLLLVAIFVLVFGEILLGPIFAFIEPSLQKRYFAYGTSLVLAILLIANIARPGFMRQLTEKLQERAYKHSRLSGIDVESLIIKLEDLFKSENLHLDPEISLEQVAHRLEINPARLSQLINQHFERNFNSYVNSYRIQTACNLLQVHSDWPVLHVCYGSGFNTSSSFYAAFKQEIGMSPAQFRKSFPES